MDSDVSVLLHCAPAQGFEEHQVQVEISSRFNRRGVPEIENHIEAVWKERVTKEPWLFNGAKFRLHSAELSTTPPQRSTNLSTTSPQRSTNLSTTPPQHSTNLSTTPPQRSTNLSTTPPQRSTNLSTTPPQRSTNLSTTPPQRSTNLSTKAGYTATQISKTAQDDEQHGNHSALNHVSLQGKECACQTDTRKSSRCKEPAGEPQNHGSPSEAILRLQLGLTCYKDFLGTNWSHEAGDLQRRGRLEVGDPQALLAQPLGVGAVLITSDGQVVMLRRSQRVAEAAGLLDIPGGHPEPKAVCREVSEEDISVDLMQGCERAVVAEIFSSVCAEVRDEVNVPLGFLSAPVLMGIALNHTSAGRPSAEFYIRCSLTMEDVKDFYWRGGPEAHESTDIVFLSQSEMMQLDVKSPLWAELCPSAKGAVLLYQLVRPDQC